MSAAGCCNRVAAVVFCALGSAAIFSSAAQAQAYPSRPIEWISHTSAGSGTDLFTRNVSEMLPLVEAKKMRVLAVTGERRFVRAPDIPMLKELGYNIVAATGRGFLMPAGVPKDAAAAMEAALKRVHDSPAYKEYSERNMFENMWLGSAEFGPYLVKRRDEMQEFLRAVGLLKP